MRKRWLKIAAERGILEGSGQYNLWWMIQSTDKPGCYDSLRWDGYESNNYEAIQQYKVDCIRCQSGQDDCAFNIDLANVLLSIYVLGIINQVCKVFCMVTFCHSKRVGSIGVHYEIRLQNPYVGIPI